MSLNPTKPLDLQWTVGKNLPKASGPYLFFTNLYLQHRSKWRLCVARPGRVKTRGNLGIANSIDEVHWQTKARAEEKWEQNNISLPIFILLSSKLAVTLPNPPRDSRKDPHIPPLEKTFSSSPSTFLSAVPLGLTLVERTRAEWVLGPLLLNINTYSPDDPI